MLKFIPRLKKKPVMIKKESKPSNDPARKPVKLVRYDELDINNTYETAGCVKIYAENILEKEPSELMAYMDSAKRFKGHFEVLDMDGGIGDIPIWYQVELVKINTDDNLNPGYKGWINSLSLESTRIRKSNML